MISIAVPLVLPPAPAPASAPAPKPCGKAPPVKQGEKEEKKGKEEKDVADKELDKGNDDETTGAIWGNKNLMAVGKLEVQM